MYMTIGKGEDNTLFYLNFCHAFANISFMTIFYGAAIQGARDRRERVHVHRAFIQTIQSLGYEVFSEHTTGQSFEETAQLLEKTLGPLPPIGPERTSFIRDKMIAGVEGPLHAAVFEVSVPSLGTGIEIAHACLRPRMGLEPVPVLALYEKDYWPHKLSSMLTGITPETLPHFTFKEYRDLNEGCELLQSFLK